MKMKIKEQVFKYLKTWWDIYDNNIQWRTFSIFIIAWQFALLIQMFTAIDLFSTINFIVNGGFHFIFMPWMYLRDEKHK